jgi:metal-responsive CopG/Arc/MetJ family transcriptional regulator
MRVKKVGISFPAELAKKLDEHAGELGMKRSRVVSLIVAKHFAQQSQIKNPPIAS